MSSHAEEQQSETANPPGRPVYRRRKFVITIAASLLLLASVWALAAYLISQERQRAFDAAAGQANAIATFFEGHVGGTFRYADDYIKTIRRIYLRDGSLDAVRRFMSDIPPDTTILSHITIMGADGVPVLISSGGADRKIKPGVNARDRDYFKIQRTSSADEVVVSMARKGRNTGLLTVRLVRRLAGLDGSFRGVIFAAVKATQLLAFFNATRMGPNATATLVGLDRLIRLRSPAVGKGASRRIEKSRLWANLDKSPRGIYHQTSIVDGVPRFWTYRTVAGFPLVAVIGTAIPDIDAAFAQTMRNGYGAAGLISAIIIVLVMFALRESATAQHLADSAARQKSGEDALRASERRYRQLAELSPEGIIVHTDGRIVYVNPEVVSMLRADGPEHLLGMPSMDLIHPDDRPGVLARRAQVAAGGRTALEEARFMCFDGTVIDVERLGTAVDWEGNPSILLILRDVSDRNRAAARLRDTESLLRTLADSSPVLISYITRDRRVRFCNTAFAARHGYDRDEIIGKHQEEFWGDEDHADVLDLIDRTLAGEVTSSERRRRHANGSMHYHFTTRAPHFGPDGEVQGYLIVAQDITEQRQAENQLRQAQRMEAVGQL
ncbi:MAG: PAS domain S-box protein, partial [Alphaproteobacteria bacterium]